MKIRRRPGFLLQKNLKTEFKNTSFVVFDIETTGGNPEKNGITEIYAIRYRDGQLSDDFYSMVNPQVAIPPIVRLTNLGIREVDKECLEAVDSFGATNWQRLTRVQMPLALPTIFAGVNQTIMMALAMVVIASMIGVKGLGVPVLRAVSNQYLALGMLNGLAIVALAIIFDRVSQQYGKRLQKHREGRNL